MSDLIDRQQAIDRSVSINLFGRDVKVVAVSELENLPSAEPETHEERTEMHACDLIERQAAIEAIRASTSKYTGFMEMEMYTDDDAVEAIESLPSAQSEIVRCKDCKWYELPSHKIYENCVR